ncbi:MAG: hypothetical protein WC389_22860, partial [Lutibacter sp.]|jgi:hypothetical protein
LNFDKKQIILYFLLNDSYDSTEQILKSFQKKYIHEYKDIQIDKVKTKCVEYRRNISKNPNFVDAHWMKIYENLSFLRNKVIDKVIETSVDYWLSVDSDILLNDTESLNILINDIQGKSIMAGIINNDQLRNPFLDKHLAACNILYFDEYGKAQHILNWKDNEIFQVDVTGAICLYDAEIFKKYPNIRFQTNRQGEDIGFFLNVKNSGIKAWATGRVQPLHVMAEGLFDICSKCSNSCYQYCIMHGERQPTLIDCPKFKEK